MKMKKIGLTGGHPKLYIRHWFLLHPHPLKEGRRSLQEILDSPLESDWIHKVQINIVLKPLLHRSVMTSLGEFLCVICHR